MADPREVELGKGMMEVLKDSCQALLIINGGGAIALGALLQATWASEAMRKPLASAMVAMAFGVLFVALTLFLRFMCLYVGEKAATMFGNWWGKLAVFCGFCSMLAFVVGVLMAYRAV